jgi:hypothetical protein
MNTVTINGKTHNLPPGNVVIGNGQIYVNGQLWNGAVLPECIIKIEGSPTDVTCDKPVTVVGNVLGNLKADGPVTCSYVGGNVEANGPVTCGDVNGSLNANGPVVCKSWRK